MREKTIGLTEEMFLTQLFNQFDKLSIVYAILRNFKTLPATAQGGDVDIFIDSSSYDFAIDLLMRHIEESNVVIVGVVKMPAFLQINISNFWGASKWGVSIEFYRDILFKGAFPLTDLTALKQCFGRSQGLSVVPERIGNTIGFIKEILSHDKLRGDKPQYWKSAESFFATERNFFCDLFRGFGSRNINSFARIFSAGSDIDRISAIKVFRWEYLVAQLFKKPISTVGKLIKHYFFVAERLFNPPGKMIAVIGVDGSGKSLLISGIQSILSSATHGACVVKHLRPGLFPPLAYFKGGKKISAEPVLDPHGSRPSGFLGSLLRLIYLTADYILGYWIKIRPQIAKQPAIVIYDRYAYDIILDPLRFRINLPAWLTRCFVSLVPKPDLILGLHADPETIFQRKNELPVDEIRRQVDELVELLKKIKKSVLISTNGTIESAKQDVLRSLHTFFSKRSEKQMKIYQAIPYMTPGVRYRAIPSKKNCRWLFPENSKLFASSWEIYHPESLCGKLYKIVARKCARLGLFLGDRLECFRVKVFESCSQLRAKVSEIYSREDLILSFSTGTPGLYQKVTAAIMDEGGGVKGYVKIARTNAAQQRLRSETQILIELNGRNESMENFSFPRVLSEELCDGVLMTIQTPCPFEKVNQNVSLDELCLGALNEMARIGKQSICFTESAFFLDLKAKLKKRVGGYPRELLQLVDILSERLGAKAVCFCLMHGDFAPWNMVKGQKMLFLYDWESAEKGAPFGMDVMHYFFQINSLLKKKRDNDLLICTLECYKEAMNKFSIQSGLSAVELLLIYLLWRELAENEDSFSQESAAGLLLIRLAMAF